MGYDPNDIRPPHRFGDNIVPPSRRPRRTAPPADWLKPGDGLAANPLPMARIVTGFPTLDTATRGGVPTGSATLTLGAPDTGKTGLAMTVADAGERQGFVVIHVCPDGGREAAEIRWAQMMGFNRDKLEERDPEELARFRGAFATRNIYLPDPDLLDGLVPVNTLANIIETARSTFADVKVLLLVDSVQTVKPDAEPRDGPRMRLEAVLGLIEVATNIPGWLIVATSQTNRASRRHKNEDENSDPMTAGMESGAIEHVFELMLFLDGDSAQPEGVRIRVTKNKPGSGRKPIFRLRWDRDRASFSEMDAQILEQQTIDMVEKQAAARRGTLLAAITKEPGLSTGRVIKACRAAGLEARDSDLVRDLQALKRAGLVLEAQKGNGYYWHPATSAQGPLPEGDQ